MTLNDNILVKGFVKAILEGKLTIEQVPEPFRKKVEEELKK